MGFLKEINKDQVARVKTEAHYPLEAGVHCNIGGEHILTKPYINKMQHTCRMHVNMYAHSIFMKQQFFFLCFLIALLFI